eukprot:870446-Rhodomonas_salina.3
MSGTDVVHGASLGYGRRRCHSVDSLQELAPLSSYALATKCPVLTNPTVLCECPVLTQTYAPIVLHSRYRMSGTEPVLSSYHPTKLRRIGSLDQGVAEYWYEAPVCLRAC